jgi:hypothetical protein
MPAQREVRVCCVRATLRGEPLLRGQGTHDAARPDDEFHANWKMPVGAKNVCRRNEARHQCAHSVSDAWGSMNRLPRTRSPGHSNVSSWRTIRTGTLTAEGRRQSAEASEAYREPKRLRRDDARSRGIPCGATPSARETVGKLGFGSLSRAASCGPPSRKRGGLPASSSFEAALPDTGRCANSSVRHDLLHWAMQGSNLQPHPCKGCALAN